MELRKIVWRGVAVIALTAAASSASLIGITSYLHQLTNQIDRNLQSVRAAEEIQLQLLWHARHLYLADVMGDPDGYKAAERDIETLWRWFDTARAYSTAGEETATLQRLGTSLDYYLADQAHRAENGQTAEREYLAAIAPFQNAYDAAEELLRVNVAEAGAITDQARFLDTVATWIGLSIAAILLLVIGAAIVGARSIVYRPLLALRDGIRQFNGRDFSVRIPARGATEIREIADAFNAMAATLGSQRDAQLSFIASVAHDLRNPLQAIKLAVDALGAKGSKPNGPAAQALVIVSRQTDVLMRLISDLLDAARVEAGRFEIEPAACDARDLVQRSVELFRPTTVLHELIVHVPEEPVPVRCDPARMEQAMNNLVSNAIKYSPNGGAIVVGTERKNDDVILEVRDHGLGISPEDQQHLFEPFRRGSERAAAIPGVGLGLSATRAIVEAHGGTIAVTSTLGRGSVFTIRLPANVESG